MKALKWFVICLLIIGIASMAIGKPAKCMGNVPAKGRLARAAGNPDPGHIKNELGTPAEAGDTPIFVYPRCQHVPFPPKDGEYRDVTNIKWAIVNVAEPGEVHLMTTDPDDNELKAFYLGEPGPDAGYINIENSTGGPKVVTILGEKLDGAPIASNGNVDEHIEWDVDGTYNRDFHIPGGGTIKSDRATIYGGGVPSPEAEPGTFHFVINSDVASSLTMSQVRFENSGLGACIAQSCGAGGITLTDNVVTNVKPLFAGLYRGNMVNFAKGLGVGYRTNLDGIQGPVTINNNYIDIWGPDIESPDPTYTASHGIAVGFMSADITADVKQNTIKNPGTVGIECTAALDAVVNIEENIVNARRALVEHPYLPWGWCINDGRYLDAISGSGIDIFNTLPPIVHISRNKLNHTAKHTAIRMAYARPLSTVENNDIYCGPDKYGQHYSNGGIALLGGKYKNIVPASCNIHIEANKITGEALNPVPGIPFAYSSGILLGHSPPLPGPYNNTIDIYPGDFGEGTDGMLQVDKLGGHVMMMTKTSGNVVNLHGTPYTLITDPATENPTYPPIIIRNLGILTPPNVVNP